MDGLGLLVVMAFIILILVIFNNESCPTCVKGEYTSLRDEGFSGAPGDWDSYASKPQTSMPTQPTITVPVVGPAAKGLTKEPVGYSGVSDLPSAPVTNLGEVNSLPFQDPRFEKVSTQMLRQLKIDMDSFSANEAPHLKDRSDPAIRLPLTRFQGDYQRIKDELAVVDRTPGFQSQLAVEDLNEMAANLRFLQRTYRLYAANEMVPAPQGGLSKVGVDSVEGFATTDVCMSGDLDTKTCSVFNNILNLLSYLSDTQKKIKSPTFFGTKDEQDLRTITSSVLVNPGFAQLCAEYNANASKFANDPSLSDLQINCPALQNKDITQDLLNILGLIHHINIKYNLGITSSSPIPKGPASLADQTSVTKLPGLKVNSATIMEAYVYQKYFPSGSSPTRPTVTRTGVTTTTTTSNTVPPVVTSYSGDPADQPISVAELNVLRQKIAIEILRLQASGTTDPVLSARVNVFKKIQTAVEGIATQVENGSMRPQEIPIKKRDYQKFLPALGDQSAGVSGLLSKTGYPSLSSLFNAYDRGDVTGAQMTENLFQHYADILLQGLSYKLDISYTSPNEVAARQAEATKAAADMANAAWPNPSIGHQIFAGLSGAFQTSHPMTSDGARGAFDAYTRQLDMQNFQGDLSFGSQGLPDGTYGRMSVMPNSAAAANFDWKGRAQTICDNVKKMGMNPADFGCQPNPQGSAQNADFSWRGYAKMVCNRLKTVADPGVPEQVGCPPDSWRGWRT